MLFRSLMCAYNQVNGEFCSDSPVLLTNILRQQWGFEGLVVTDWGAMHDRIRAMEAGCDLLMPGGSDYMEQELLRAVREGKLAEQDIDRCAMRVLKLMAQRANLPQQPYDQQAHHDLAVKVAAQSAVLLKNDGSLLPLRNNQKVALIGVMAQKPRYQGSGSSHINPHRLVSPLQAMDGCAYAPGCREDGSTDEALLTQAAVTAGQAEVAVVFAGLPAVCESEDDLIQHEWRAD